MCLFQTNEQAFRPCAVTLPCHPVGARIPSASPRPSYLSHNPSLQHKTLQGEPGYPWIPLLLFISEESALRVSDMVETTQASWWQSHKKQKEKQKSKKKQKEAVFVDKGVSQRASPDQVMLQGHRSPESYSQGVHFYLQLCKQCCG